MTQRQLLGKTSSSANQHHANLTSTGNQAKEVFLESFSKMTASSDEAIRLKAWALSAVVEDRFMVMRAGNLQLSWVASEIGIDRQKLYPGRGPGDLQDLISILSKYAKSIVHSSTTTNKKVSNDVTGLRTALAVQHKKVHELKAEVSRLKLMHDLIHSGKPLVL